MKPEHVAGTLFLALIAAILIYGSWAHLVIFGRDVRAAFPAALYIAGGLAAVLMLGYIAVCARRGRA